MEQVKIDNFYRENPQVHYPEYVTLDSENCANIRASLSKKLGLNTPADSMTLVNLVDRHGKLCEEFNCKEDDFNLKRVLSSLGISWPEYVFVNWYRYDIIDKLRLCDLTNYFDDIWYEDVDDIDIFDDMLEWVLSVTHYGQIKILKI
ncbi:hypothetical protein [Nitrincola sp. MINF-07-Sa-05]|uniref:hypothetical protein n=1 Tax=Nitrincola salilacus TaxID=3400273 RepID=UPI003918034A